MTRNYPFDDVSAAQFNIDPWVGGEGGPTQDEKLT